MTGAATAGGIRPLKDRLAARLERDGPISVRDYMAICLGDPADGYYRRREAIGRKGDFITAPEISQIFGELVGVWAIAVWQQMGEPDRVRLVEFGPGRGTMMRDMVRVLQLRPAMRDGVDVVLVEISERLQTEQAETLEGTDARFAWCDARGCLDSCVRDPLPTIVLANEFVDALPVEQLVLHAGEWRRRMVACDAGGRFGFVGDARAWSNPPGQSTCFDALADVEDGDVCETRWRELTREPDGLARLLGQVAQTAPLGALVVDYGYEGPAVGDSLQGVAGHAHVDPLADPGQADLSAYVDFSELADAFAGEGLMCDGPVTQSRFLGALGFGARLERLLSGKPAGVANAIETAAHRLIAEPGMGSRFCAMVVRSPELAPLPPFASPDGVGRTGSAIRTGR